MSMRILVILLLFATACMDVPLSGPRYDSVRERLSEVSTSLYVRDDASSGAIGARRRGSDGWIVGGTDLAIERGYVRAAITDSSQLDDRDQLEITQLEIALAPITLDAVFNRPAQLQDVTLRLTKPARGEAAWTSSDAATATLMMQFDFGWKIAFDGGEAYPLATQHLPLESVDVVLTGSGDHVGAWLDLEAAGQLWNWADIVQITDLSLSVRADTAD
jgi:hypothetical protein